MSMIYVNPSRTAEFRVRFAGDTTDWGTLPVAETLFVMGEDDAEHASALVADAHSTEQSKVVAVRWNYQGSDKGYFVMMRRPLTVDFSNCGNATWPALMDRLKEISSKAYAKYNACYDNGLYVAAVGDDTERGVKLSDTALALCGHPGSAVDASFANDVPALMFLSKFA